VRGRYKDGEGSPFSELLEATISKGPQIVTRRGVEASGGSVPIQELASSSRCCSS